MERKQFSERARHDCRTEVSVQCKGNAACRHNSGTRRYGESVMMWVDMMDTGMNAQLSKSI